MKFNFEKFSIKKDYVTYFLEAEGLSYLSYNNFSYSIGTETWYSEPDTLIRTSDIPYLEKIYFNNKFDYLKNIIRNNKDYNIQFRVNSDLYVFFIKSGLLYFSLENDNYEAYVYNKSDKKINKYTFPKEITTVIESDNNNSYENCPFYIPNLFKNKEFIESIESFYKKEL